MNNTGIVAGKIPIMTPRTTDLLHPKLAPPARSPSAVIYVVFLGLFAGGGSFGWSKSVVLGVILGIFPATIPVLFIGLHLFVSVVQAYVFTVLPSVYLGLAISEEH